MLSQKETKNQESIIAAAHATRHRMLSVLTRNSLGIIRLPISIRSSPDYNLIEKLT